MLFSLPRLAQVQIGRVDVEQRHLVRSPLSRHKNIIFLSDMSGYKSFAISGLGNLGIYIAQDLLKERRAGNVTDILLLTRAVRICVFVRNSQADISTPRAPPTLIRKSLPIKVPQYSPSTTPTRLP